MSVSSDLIPVDSSSEVAAVAVKSGKKEVVSADAVASWLETTSSGKELLSSVLPSTVKKRYSGANIVGWTGTKEVVVFSYVSGLLSSLFGAIVGAAINSHHIVVGEPTNVSVVWPTLVAAVAGGFSFYVPTRIKVSKCQALWNKLMPIQSEGTRKWLEARYAVAVSNEVLAVLASGALTNQDSVPFADEKGQLWVLRKNSSGLYQVEPQQVIVKASEAPEGIRQATVVLSVGAAHLDGELGQLGEKIDARLSQLHQFALTTEEAHVVSRAVKDAQEAVITFEQLRILGAEASGVVQLVDVMNILLSELESIATRKAAEVSERLAAQQALVNARHSEIEV